MKANAIIILGSGVNKDGSLPPIAVQRVNKGMELFKKGLAEKIIVSGKKPFRKKPLLISEARAMANYLKEKGIPEKNIILEEESQDTLENAFFTKTRILKPNKWNKIIIVTSDFHMSRTKYLFKKILGRNYKILFEESKSNLSKRQKTLLEKKETDKLRLIRNLLRDSPDGEEEKIRQKLIKELYQEIN